MLAMLGSAFVGIGFLFQFVLGETSELKPVYPLDIQISFDQASHHVEMSADAVLGIKDDPREYKLKLHGSYDTTIQRPKVHKGTVASRISNFTLQGYSYELGAVAITQDESRPNYISDTRLYNLVNATLVRELMGVFLQLTLEWSPRPRATAAPGPARDADADCVHKYGHPETIAYTRFKGIWKSTAHDYDHTLNKNGSQIFRYPHLSQRFSLDHEVRFLWEDEGLPHDHRESQPRIVFQNKNPFVLKRCDIMARWVKPGEERWPRPVNIANIGGYFRHERDRDRGTDDGREHGGGGGGLTSTTTDSYLI